MALEARPRTSRADRGTPADPPLGLALGSQSHFRRSRFVPDGDQQSRRVAFGKGALPMSVGPRGYGARRSDARPCRLGDGAEHYSDMTVSTVTPVSKTPRRMRASPT